MCECQSCEVGGVQYLPSSKPFKDATSAFSSPTVWLSRMRLVEDDACRKATRQTHPHTQTHTPAPLRSGAKSQHTPFNKSPVAPLEHDKIIKSALWKSESTRAYKVNKYSQCKCQRPHVFVSQIIHHHNNRTTACCRRWRRGGRTAQHRRPAGR